jgi:hypothetical protein
MDKIFGTAAKALGVFIAAVIIIVVFRVAWNFVFYGNVSAPAGITDTRDGRYQDSLRTTRGERQPNRVKSKFLSDCHDQGAPVTQLGGGRMNCYRAPTVETFIDGERVQ